MKFAAIADWANPAEGEPRFTLTFMCAELGVTTSGYHRWVTARTPATGSAGGL